MATPLVQKGLRNRFTSFFIAGLQTQIGLSHFPLAPTAASSSRSQGISPEEKATRRQKRLCFYCGEGKHLAVDYPRGILSSPSSFLVEVCLNSQSGVNGTPLPLNMAQ